MISTVTYNGDGATRIFPVAFEIKGEEYTVVYVGGVSIADRSLYDIINNAIVFNTAPVIGTNNVEIVVASTTTEIADLNAPPSTIQTVLDNMADINAIVDTVIPNIDEILLADNNATIATTKALEALTSAGNALTSEANADASANIALTQAGIATTKAGESSASAISADADATTATTQAGIATTKADEASADALLALGYRNEAEAFADSIDTVAIQSQLDAKLPKTGGTMTGAITALRETKVAMGANDIDLATGNVFTKTITTTTTLTVSNALASGNANSFILELTNGGAYAITWFSGTKWSGGTAPTLTASGVDVLGFYSHDGGTTWRGMVLAKDNK